MREERKSDETKEGGREGCIRVKSEAGREERERAAPHLQQALLQDLYGEVDAFRVPAPAHRSKRTRAEDFKHLAVGGGGREGWMGVGVGVGGWNGDGSGQSKGKRGGERICVT